MSNCASGMGHAMPSELSQPKRFGKSSILSIRFTKERETHHGNEEVAGAGAGGNADYGDGEPSGDLQLLVSSADASDAAFEKITDPGA